MSTHNIEIVICFARKIKMRKEHQSKLPISCLYSCVVTILNLQGLVTDIQKGKLP